VSGASRSGGRGEAERTCGLGVVRRYSGAGTHAPSRRAGGFERRAAALRLPECRGDRHPRPSPHGRRQPIGTVELAGQTFEATAVWTAKSTLASAEPVGFRVDGAEGPAGAVEVVRPGRIWFSKKLGSADRRDFACLLARVLL